MTGLLEFFLTDPDGSRVRIGSPSPAGSRRPSAQTYSKEILGLATLAQRASVARMLAGAEDLGLDGETLSATWRSGECATAQRRLAAAVAARLDVGDRRAQRCAAMSLMTIVRSLLLFAVAAFAEIGGAWLVWQGVREHKGPLWIGAGVAALGAYGFVATLQPDANFGRILAAYGGVFVAGSLAWAMAVDHFRPDRYDLAGAALCLLGVTVIMYAPRS